MMNADSPGEDHFETLLRKIDEDTDWSYSDTNPYSVAESAGRLADETGPGVLYDSEETEGQLRLRNNHGENASLGGDLIQSLASVSMDPEEDTFPHKVGEAYNSIAQEFVEDDLYIEESRPEANPIDVLRVNVPVDYEEAVLTESLSKAGEASKEVQEMLDEIDAVVEHRL